MNVHWKKSTNERRGSPNRNVMRLSEKFLEVVSVFKKASKSFMRFFSLELGTRQCKNLKNHLPIYRKK
jgi:hypothetical protein